MRIPKILAIASLSACSVVFAQSFNEAVASAPAPAMTASAAPAASGPADSTASSVAGSEIGVKSAAYIESLRLSGVKKQEVTKASTSSDVVASKDTKPKLDTIPKQKVAQVTESTADKKGPVNQKPKAKKPIKVVKSDNQTNSYAKEARPTVYAVYPELSAIYSKDGEYHAIIKIGDRTITAKNGENTICGKVIILNINSVKVGAQVLTLN